MALGLGGVAMALGQRSIDNLIIRSCRLSISKKNQRQKNPYCSWSSWLCGQCSDSATASIHFHSRVRTICSCVMSCLKFLYFGCMSQLNSSSLTSTVQTVSMCLIHTGHKSEAIVFMMIDGDLTPMKWNEFKILSGSGIQLSASPHQRWMLPKLIGLQLFFVLSVLSADWLVHN
jgi:hypothetical protein